MDKHILRKRKGIKETDKCYLCSNKAQIKCNNCKEKICNNCKEENENMCYKCYASKNTITLQ
jgi:hypothetical protein